VNFTLTSGHSHCSGAGSGRRRQRAEHHGDGRWWGRCQLQYPTVVMTESTAVLLLVRQHSMRLMACRTYCRVCTVSFPCVVWWLNDVDNVHDVHQSTWHRSMRSPCYTQQEVAAWFSGNVLVLINVVALRRGPVSTGMGDRSRVYHLGI